MSSALGSCGSLARGKPARCRRSRQIQPCPPDNHGPRCPWHTRQGQTDRRSSFQHRSPPRPPHRKASALHAACQRRARASPQNATPRRRPATSHACDAVVAGRRLRRARIRAPASRSTAANEPTVGTRPGPGIGVRGNPLTQPLLPASCQELGRRAATKSLKFHGTRVVWQPQRLSRPAPAAGECSWRPGG